MAKKSTAQLATRLVDSGLIFHTVITIVCVIVIHRSTHLESSFSSSRANSSSS